MALPINIHELINGITIESERLEFKKGWNKEAVLHTICAFANDFNNWGGGYIIIGIEANNGVPILPSLGLELNQIDKILRELLGLCNSAIRPQYTSIAEHVTYQDKNILIVWVPGGQSRPYKARTSLARDSKEYIPFIRKYASTVIASHEEERELYSLASRIP